MAESYEDYLKRVQSVYGMPGGFVDGKSTMTVQSTPDYRRTQWGNSLSNDDLTALVQAGVDNRNLIEPVFDPANPITSKVTTEKDHLGNSVTKTYKGNFDGDNGTPNFDKVGAAASSAYDAVEDGVSSFYDGVNSWGSGVADIVGDKFDAGISAVNGVRQDVESSVGSAYEDVNEFGSSMADSVVDGYKAVTSFPGDTWDAYGAGSGYFSDMYDNAIDSIATAADERYSPFIDSITSGYNKVMSGEEIVAGDAGSDANIKAAQLKVNEAINRVEKELNLSYSVPTLDEVHPIDAHPLVVEARENLELQFNAKEKFESKDVINVDKVINAIASSDKWENVEAIANSLEQKGYKAGDDITEWAAENPWTALASVFYGGPIVGAVAKGPIMLATYLASKAPGLALRGFKWLAKGNGIVLTGLGVEQYFKNEKAVDKWIDDNIPAIIHSPIETVASALTDTEKSDSEIVDDMEIIQTSAQLNSSDDTGVAILDSTEVPANKAVVDSVNPNEPAVAEPAPETSIFEAVTPSQLEAPVVKDLIENAGVENLSPTTDEAAVVLSKTPELIEVMNSLADYMDSSTDEDALAAARQTAIDIENDPSHSDLSSAAAMTFIASMMFGGNMTDSFNAAFKPVGNYYEAKKAAAIKRKDEAVAEKTRIDLENRAAALEQTKYDRNLADSKEAAAVTAAARVAEFNATAQQTSDQFNIQEKNDLLIAGVKENASVKKAFLKDGVDEKKRVLAARDTYYKAKLDDVPDELKQMLLNKNLPSFGSQLTSALAEMKGVYKRGLNKYGDPLQFDMSLLENQRAVNAAINNYTQDLNSGFAGRRQLSSYVKDMIIKRELPQFTQVIKPAFFQVPDEGESMLKFKWEDSKFDDDAYEYKKQKKRGTLGKTDASYAETTAKVYDFIQNTAFNSTTSDGNGIGMTVATELFAKDYMDAQTNDPAYFDRVVRAAVKEGVHPFTYFMIQYMKSGKGQLGNRFPAK